MGEPSKGRAAFKFLFWTAAAVGMILIVVHSHTSGQMAAWYYYSAAEDGYAVNADTFENATKSSPAVLQIGQFARIEGQQAVPVKKGDRLPLNANGVILTKILKDGKRATLQGNQLTVTTPWEIQQSKGFKFKDTFKHKGIRTYPWAAVWNVLMVAGLGLSLGFMAEGFTDLVGIKFEKIRHFEGH